jgi:chemotaxis protein MotB
MARRRHAAHENHERWLVSYADFITLLFAFFVVMFAVSQEDKNKVKQMSQSVRQAFEESELLSAIDGIVGKEGKKPKEQKHVPGPNDQAKDDKPSDTAMIAVQELMPQMRMLRQSLVKPIEDGRIAMTLEPRGLVVSMREAVLFKPADDVIQRDALPIIEEVAAAVRDLPNPVRLEGHTDSTPIQNARFRSNWELSAARSIAMLELLNGRFSLPRERLAISGFADTIPISENDSTEGRARNRRVDVVILNQFGMKNEPARGANTANNKPSPIPEKESGERQ